MGTFGFVLLGVGLVVGATGPSFEHGPIYAGGLRITVPEPVAAVNTGASAAKSQAEDAGIDSGARPISAGGLRIVVPDVADAFVVDAGSARSLDRDADVVQQQERAFMQWLSARGAKVQGLAIRHDKSGNRGVYATQHFRKDEVIMLIPHELVLNSVSVKASARDKSSLLSKYLGGDFLSRVELQDCSLIALFVMFERFLSRQSLWTAYLDILPSKINTPIMWTEESNKLELQLLHTSPGLRATYENTMRRLGAPDNWIAQLRRILLPALSRDFGVSEQQLLRWLHWAFAVVTSRAWGRMAHGEPSNCNMIPMADMLNHHHDANEISFIEPPDWSGSTTASGDAGWGTTTNWDVKPGDEVFDTYNKEKNYVLCRGVGLITFGFVDLSHDATDCSWLQIEIEEQLLRPDLDKDQGRHAADRASMLQHIGDTMPKSFVFELRNRETAAFELPVELLGTMRLLHLAHPVEAERARNSTQSGNSIPILSLTNERQALQSLKRVFQQMLAKFPSDVSGDAARIAQLTKNASTTGLGSAVGADAVLCVRFGEFKLYKRALQKVDEMWLNLLSAHDDINII